MYNALYITNPFKSIVDNTNTIDLSFKLKWDENCGFLFGIRTISTTNAFLNSLLFWASILGVLAQTIVSNFVWL